MCCSNFFIAIIRPRQLLEGSFAAYSSRGVSVCDHHGGEHGSRQMGVIQSYGGAVAGSLHLESQAQGREN